VVLSRVVFFSSFVQEKQKKKKKQQTPTHPPRFFEQNVELLEGVKGPLFKPLYLELYGWFCLVLFFSPPLCSKNKKKQQTPTHQDSLTKAGTF
jgi:hypothetical protein